MALGAGLETVIEAFLGGLDQAEGFGFGAIDILDAVAAIPAPGDWHYYAIYWPGC